jgi:hypothetical protein
MLWRMMQMAFTRFLSGYYDVENQLPAYIIDRAREYFREEEKKKTGLKTIEDVNSRRERIRKCFIELFVRQGRLYNDREIPGW